jgi:hypothetical protein
MTEGRASRQQTLRHDGVVEQRARFDAAGE